MVMTYFVKQNVLAPRIRLPLTTVRVYKLYLLTYLLTVIIDNMRHIFWDMWIRNNFKYLKWSSRSFKVIDVSTIRQGTYDFILVFHRIYVSVPFSRYYRLFRKMPQERRNFLSYFGITSTSIRMSNSNHTIITVSVLMRPCCPARLACIDVIVFIVVWANKWLIDWLKMLLFYSGSEACITNHGSAPAARWREHDRSRDSRWPIPEISQSQTV